jgi:uncharacterized membrane protein YhaH (DUF805 family)
MPESNGPTDSSVIESMNERELLKNKSDEDLVGIFIEDQSGYTVRQIEEVKKEIARRGLLPRYYQTKFLVKRTDGTQTGPHNWVEIKRLFLEGSLTKDSMIHVQSIYGWTNLAKVFDFSIWETPAPKTNLFKTEVREVKPSPQLESESLITTQSTTTSGPDPTAGVQSSQLFKSITSCLDSGKKRVSTLIGRSQRLSVFLEYLSPIWTKLVAITNEGIGRIAYAGIFFSITVAFAVVISSFATSTIPIPRALGLFANTILSFGYIWASAARFRDIGLRGWWALLFLIPYVNVLIFLFCLFAPADTFQRARR